MPLIKTPDQRVRVFISSTINELAEERKAARTATFLGAVDNFIEQVNYPLNGASTWMYEYARSVALPGPSEPEGKAWYEKGKKWIWTSLFLIIFVRVN